MTPSWSDEFTAMFDLAVYLSAPVDVRLKRIENREMRVGVTVQCAPAPAPAQHREYARWGDRVREGGDMYEQQQKFREFAGKRNIALLEQQAASYPCPPSTLETQITATRPWQS